MPDACLGASSAANHWTQRAMQTGMCIRVCKQTNKSEGTIEKVTERKRFGLLLPQGSFLSLYFLSVLPAIPSPKEKSLVQPQVVEMGAGCSAYAIIVDFVSGRDECCVCVCLISFTVSEYYKMGCSYN